MKFVVTEKAQRPAKMNGTCFYCKMKIGENHKDDCVLVKKNVTIRLTIEYDIPVPASWDKNQVEFHRNEGTWCADNCLEELSALAQKEGCLCNRAHFEYVEDGEGEPYIKEL